MTTFFPNAMCVGRSSVLTRLSYKLAVPGVLVLTLVEQVVDCLLRTGLLKFAYDKT